MLLTILIVIITSTAFCISLATNPLSLGLLILLTALTLSMTFATSISSWVALLIFLIYVGGILVIFSYFVSIIPNQTISPTIPIIIILIFCTFIALTIIFLSPPILSTHITQLNIMYNHKNFRILIVLASILIFTIVIVVKVSLLKKGALRSFSTYV